MRVNVWNSVSKENKIWSSAKMLIKTSSRRESLSERARDNENNLVAICNLPPRGWNSSLGSIKSSALQNWNHPLLPPPPRCMSARQIRKINSHLIKAKEPNESEARASVAGPLGATCQTARAPEIRNYGCTRVANENVINYSASDNAPYPALSLSLSDKKQSRMQKVCRLLCRGAQKVGQVNALRGSRFLLLACTTDCSPSVLNARISLWPTAFNNGYTR